MTTSQYLLNLGLLGYAAHHDDGRPGAGRSPDGPRRGGHVARRAAPGQEVLPVTLPPDLVT